jgi:hypothetical protein
VIFILLVPLVWLARPPFRAAGIGGTHQAGATADD